MPVSRIKDNIKVDNRTGCWNWQNHIGTDGYGQIRYEGRLWKAHRLAFVLFSGECIDDKILLHSCDNRRCVNPDHLTPGTHQENSDDKVAKGRHARGEQIGAGKLSSKSVEQIHRWNSQGVSLSEIVETLGVHRRTARRVLSGETWWHLHPDNLKRDTA